jgi:hypothetical protein
LYRKMFSDTPDEVYTSLPIVVVESESMNHCYVLCFSA